MYLVTKNRSNISPTTSRHSFFEAMPPPKPRQLSNNGTLSCSIMAADISGVARPEVKQWKMTPKTRALSPIQKRATFSHLSN
ncbi:hypothetical protein TNCV_4361931 [Trichonephila clavipes]|nr:hypothetical protein TNCV_4361931 [Trichonephila clavipes]